MRNITVVLFQLGFVAGSDKMPRIPLGFVVPLHAGLCCGIAFPYLSHYLQHEIQFTFHYLVFKDRVYNSCSNIFF